MDYIHTWLNKWRMQGNFTKSKVMVFHPEGESSVPAQDRLNTWTLGIATPGEHLQVPRRSVPGRWIMAGTRKGARKDASSLWVLEATATCSSLPTKVRLLMVQTFIYPRSCMARWDTTKAVKDKMSAVVKKAPQHSSPASPRLLF
jgi:hypothetical protein